MKMAARKCRVWWPEQLLSCTSSSCLLLFGWLMDSVNAIDIVVATAIPSHKILSCPLQDKLEEILKSVSGRMPMGLQESSTFSILGCCLTDCPNKKLEPVRSQKDGYPLPNVEDYLAKTDNFNVQNLQHNQECHLDRTVSEIRRQNCGCEEFIEPHWQSLISDNWILILCKPLRILFKGNKQIPCLHHVHQNGDVLSPADVHIIIYEAPICGVSHFSLSSWHSPKHASLQLKKPNWVNELYKKPLLLDLDRVLLALNCSHVAQVFFEQTTSNFSSMIHSLIMPIMPRLVSIIWHAVAAVVASIATILYIFLQCFRKPLSYGSVLVILQKMFMHTCKNIHIRSCQFLYWPVLLQGTGISSQSNVEYYHRAALRKHNMWSNILMDVIFGTVLGILLLANVEAICNWVLDTAHQVTNDLLRSGCVWLMGVPAGFKLNNELAEVIGMISLNAIQIFSTLCFFLGAFLQFYIQILALLGIVFGLTVSVALCIDTIKLATLHIYVLHWLISHLYSQQIQASASLWRLFRGRKQNPLRQRLDSYDYTVEQHVVGSLLFTPLLLLIPTTSVFYIFFTSLITAIVFICIVFEMIISLLHATPYAEVFIRIMNRRRFPSGLWFRILYPDHAVPYKVHSTTCSSSSQNDGGSESLVSLLCSNYAALGQVVRPYYADIFSGIAPSFCKSLAHGILSGRRFPSILGTRSPQTIPWMQITSKEYWKLCYNAVLSNKTSDLRRTCGS